MALIPLKGEVQEIAGLLESGGESPEELAKEVIRTLDRMREFRRLYVVVAESPVGDDGFRHWATGPYATVGKAVTSAERGEIPKALDGDRFRVAPLLGVGYWKAQLERADRGKQSTG